MGIRGHSLYHNAIYALRALFHNATYALRALFHKDEFVFSPFSGNQYQNRNTYRSGVNLYTLYNVIYYKCILVHSNL